MAADGTWKLTLQTPMGDRQATLAITTSGNTLTGQQSGEGNNTQDIFDGSVAGNTLSWKVSITNPMPMTLEFNGTVVDNTLSGSMKAGAFGSWPFTGQRA
jgi:hypothetical protein